MKKYIILGLLIVLSFLFSVQRAIKVDINTKYDEIVNYQLFYTTEEKETFSKFKSISFSNRAGTTKKTVYISEDKIYQLRLDTVSAVQNLVIDSILVQNQKLDNTKFIPNSHVEKYSSDENRIQMSSSKKDPHIIYSEKLNNIDYGIHINFERMLLLFLLGLYIYWLFADYRKEELMTMPTNMQSQEAKQVNYTKIHNLGFLRLVFAISVVCTHFFGILSIPKTGTSVEFFFILSGFFLAYTFKPEKTTLNYIKKRFIQFAPLVVFGCLICGGGLASFKGALFLQNTGLAFGGDLLNAPAWYIGVLFWISLFYFALLKTVSDKNKLYLIVGTIAFIACIICARAPGDRLELVFDLFPKGLFRGLACVGIGVLLQSVVKMENRRPNLWYTILEAALLVMMFLGLFYYPMHFPYWFYSVICWSVLIYLFLSRRGYITKALDKPIFSKLSTFCLSMFLTHWFVTSTASKYGTIWWIKQYKPEWFESEKALVIVLVLVSAFIVAIFAHYFVEKPCTKLLKKVLK